MLSGMLQQACFRGAQLHAVVKRQFDTSLHRTNMNMIVFKEIFKLTRKPSNWEFQQL